MTAENLVGPGSYPPPDVPRLSITERDTRWARVRKLMDRDGLDAIVALHNSSNWDYGNANSRYLSSIGGNTAQVSVVFPRDGAVTAVTGPVPTPAYWREFQRWVDDIRPSFFHPVPVVIDRLRELGLERSRIGIAGLAGVARLPNGLVSVGDYRALEEGLPGVDFVNATAQLYEARFVKSAEEIALLERSVSLVEAALDVLEREARPGVPERIVYGRMVAALLEQGSEPSSLLLWTAGNPLPPAVGSLASGRPLGADDVISVEVDAKWAGYLGHGAMTTWVGEPDATVREMAEVQLEATRRCWNALRPGATLGDVVGVCAEVAAGTPFECEPIVHSRGLGMDAPVLVFRARDERTRDWVIAENAVFIVKPQVKTADGARRVMWGDTVVVTATGARRLGHRLAPLAADGRDRQGDGSRH